MPTESVDGLDFLRELVVEHWGGCPPSHGFPCRLNSHIVFSQFVQLEAVFQHAEAANLPGARLSGGGLSEVKAESLLEVHRQVQGQLCVLPS